jgi:hypothetical protein
MKHTTNALVDPSFYHPFAYNDIKRSHLLFVFVGQSKDKFVCSGEIPKDGKLDILMSLGSSHEIIPDI